MRSFLRYTMFLILIGICHFTSLYPQVNNKNEDGIEFRRNAIYGSAGLGLMYVTGSWYYERIIDTDILSGNAIAFLRIGSTKIGGARTGQNLSFEGGLLIVSMMPQHLELAGGWHPKIGEYSDFLPVGGSFAYRYQKSQGRFIFRFGVGYPEALFISMGFSF